MSYLSESAEACLAIVERGAAKAADAHARPREMQAALRANSGEPPRCTAASATRSWSAVSGQVFTA